MFRYWNAEFKLAQEEKGKPDGIGGGGVLIALKGGGGNLANGHRRRNRVPTALSLSDCVEFLFSSWASPDTLA